MKFLSVRDLRGKSAEVWRDLPAEKEMVITSNGRPVAVLTAVDERSVEDSIAAWRQVRAAQALAEIQQESVRKGTDSLSMKEIDREIQAVRTARKRKT